MKGWTKPKKLFEECSVTFFVELSTFEPSFQTKAYTQNVIHSSLNHESFHSQLRKKQAKNTPFLLGIV